MNESSRDFRLPAFALVAALALALVGGGRVAAAASTRDPKVDKLVTRGLDWVASTQSRLGHWTANEGRYPTAMTALAGMALLAEARPPRKASTPRTFAWPSTTWSRAAAPTA